MRFKMVVADPDKSYLSALEKYFIGNYVDRFHLSFFSKKEYLDEFLTKNHDEVDILLVSSNFFTEDIEKVGVKKIFILSEGQQILFETKNISNINKYQPCDALVSKIMDTFGEGNSLSQVMGAHKERNSSVKILSVYSPAGGSGTTSVAIAAATLLAQMGKSVFYLNFEGISSMGLYLQQKGEYNASNLFYLMKNRKKNMTLKLESMLIKDYTTQVFYIEAPESPLEWEEINGEDIEYLLSELQESGRFDYIIVDLSSTFDSKNSKIINLSHHVMTLITPHGASEVKLEKFLKEISRNPHVGEGTLDKIYLVMNHSEHQEEEIRMGGKIISYQLPKSHECWVKRESQLVLNSSSSFAMALYGILIDLDK